MRNKLGKYRDSIVFEGCDHGIPETMQLRNVKASACEFKEVASLVSIWILLGEATASVQRLVHVSH